MTDVPSQSPPLSWIAAEDGYRLALLEGKLICQNPKGKQLKSVPSKIKKGSCAEELLSLCDWLEEHQRTCSETVDTWMLRGLPIPCNVLEKIWSDSAWKSVLENAVIVSIETDGQYNLDAAGFLRDIDGNKGVGVVDLDGETQWLKAKTLAIPHPILLQELNDYRELATELSCEQGLSQLFRDTWNVPSDLSIGAKSVEEFTGGKFEQLNFAHGTCKKLGYRIRGGFATTSVWENNRVIEARYWIGAESPESETYTGDLSWVDDNEQPIKLSEVGPVAFSEGKRMASAIYAKRSIEKKEGE